jgi:MscS family membrane protein
MIRGRACATVALAAVLLCASVARAQEAARNAVEADSLGRDTPRGTVLGFIEAAGKGNFEAAALYLNADPRGPDAATLAHQFYVVLDTRLPARPRDLSDRPDGSQINPLKPNQDVVGTITTSEGPLDIVVERVNRSGKRLWLFSRPTLDAIPAAYGENDLVAIESHLPKVFLRPRIAGIRPFNWLTFLALPLLYYVIGLVGVPLSRGLTAWRRRSGRPAVRAAWIPGPVRLIVLALAIRWLETTIDLRFFERGFWNTVVAMLVAAAIVWALLAGNGYGERRIARRFSGVRYGEVAGLLRLTRRAADVIAVTIGIFILLRYFGIDATAALAGLGIGGIAVALSAQKTLENVIGGVSIIMDQAVRVGDFLKIGDVLGTVDFIGLRSTRIRTLDRTVLTVPNGQLATINIETLSVRDKYWFHHVVPLRYETTAAQMRGVVDGVRAYLAGHSRVDRTETLRVRFLRFGAFSLDVDLFAYIIARDWEDFLETQQELMLEVMAIVERSGAAIALPAQRLHVVDAAASSPLAISHQQSVS